MILDSILIDDYVVDNENGSPKGTINFSERSKYGYPYLNELISIVRSVCGVSFKFNSKFSCFCQKNLAKEFYHFSIFQCDVSNPQVESIQQDSMNIETTPQQPNLAPQEAISINHDAVKNTNECPQ